MNRFTKLKLINSVYLAIPPLGFTISLFFKSDTDHYMIAWVLSGFISSVLIWFILAGLNYTGKFFKESINATLVFIFGSCILYFISSLLILTLVTLFYFEVIVHKQMDESLMPQAILWGFYYFYWAIPMSIFNFFYLINGPDDEWRFKK